MTLPDFRNGIRIVAGTGAPRAPVAVRNYDAPASPGDRQKKWRAKSKSAALENIAILDMETDPFDKELKQQINPFLAVLYSDNFEPIVIWEENRNAFIHKVISAIEALPNAYTIYAHNGGKFDFLFLVSKLRGEIQFKGRGIMSAKVGNHELRDSFHIIPERLANYQKDAFNYENMRKGKRDTFREEIISYCIADCRYLLDLVKGFINEFGFKLSIGQAAMTRLKAVYKFKTLTASQDDDIRRYYFGGRVECLQGRAIVNGHYKLYDVNSMYPDAMANCRHPIGNEYITRPGLPGPYTCFLDIECKNFGAMVRKTDNNETSATEPEGRFLTTIHEYEMALKLGLIEDVKINFVVDNMEQTDFSKFVNPLYERRLLTKEVLTRLKDENAPEDQFFYDTKKDDIFLKLILNNAYGKFATNPRKYKETYFTDPGELPPPEFEGCGYLPVYECEGYWVWERPSPQKRFYNVGTAASITGAARAKLMEAIHLAEDPIYCDTDSLICRELPGMDLHPTRLGAWDLEAEFAEVIINGKKMYSCVPLNGGKPKTRSKGVQGVTHEQMRQIFHMEAGEALRVTNPAPTMTKTGKQFYMTRNVRATAAKRIKTNGNIASRGRLRTGAA